jgi:general stress protein 26
MKKKGEKTQGDKVENLSDRPAIEKIQELVDHNSICMFTTRLDDAPLTTRPMGVQKVDDEGNLWFLSALSSRKNGEIEMDSRIQLFFSNVSDQEYLSLYGTATVVRDKEKIKELWNPIAKAWFNEGVDDPDISALRVAPQEAYYWDTKSGRMISLLKILASAVTGRTLEEGVQGTITVSETERF